MDADQIKTLLSSIPAPKGGDLVSSGLAAGVEVEGEGLVTVTLNLNGLSRAERHALEDAVRSKVAGHPGVTELYIETEVDDLPAPSPAPRSDAGLSVHGGTPAPKPKGALSEVRHLIAVASGKGGVGKSTVAVNLALALAARGARVGLCDLDIYGPSAPVQLGVVGAKPRVSGDQKRFLPVPAYGLGVMSIGFLVDDDTPVIWRGPIVSSVVKQFLEDVEWGPLDYLVIDMPPGTGDAQLTLSQTAPLTGSIIVTTPSELALVDAIKGLQMFRKVDVPVVGLVENMSHYECPKCGHESHPFNHGGVQRVAAQFGVPVLATIPVALDVQRGSDTGKPIVATDPEGSQARAFLNLADAVREKFPLPSAAADAEPKKKGLLASIFRR